MRWELDTNSYDVIPFKGFEAQFLDSRVTGGERLKYDRDQPTDIEIKYYNVYKPTLKTMAPKFYIVPQAWKEVLERLKKMELK